MISRVLIIDDEPDWQETFKDVFASVGCDADSVADISGAKELLKTTHYELIILDIFLNPTQVPLNYERFLTFIERAYPEVIVVAVTGKQLAPDEAFALSRLGVSDFIYKPRVHLDDVRRLAHRILDLDKMETSSIGTLERRLERIERLLANGIETLSTSVTEVTGLTRAVIKLASADVSDCPRLFTLKGSIRQGSITSCASQLCAYTLVRVSRRRACMGHGDLQVQSTEGVAAKSSALCAFGKPCSECGDSGSRKSSRRSGEDLQRVKNQLELMKEIAAQLPQIKVSPSATRTTVDRLTPEEGAGLRALRALSLTEDKYRIFGDLRKVGTESGGIHLGMP